MSRNVQKCPEMSRYVQKCQEMCRNVQKCAYVIHGCPLQSRCHEEVLYTRLNRSCSINSAASFPPANNTAASTSASSSVSTCLAAAASADAAVAASMEAAAETPNNFTQQHKGSFYSAGTFVIKFIYSEKATQFCEISIEDLSFIVTVKSTVEILQNFVAFSEYLNFIPKQTNHIIF